jgi:hypothetical protein
MQKRQDVRNEKYRMFGEGGTKRSLPIFLPVYPFGYCVYSAKSCVINPLSSIVAKMLHIFYNYFSQHNLSKLARDLFE